MLMLLPKVWVADGCRELIDWLVVAVVVVGVVVVADIGSIVVVVVVVAFVSEVVAVAAAVGIGNTAAVADVDKLDQMIDEIDITVDFAPDSTADLDIDKIVAPIDFVVAVVVHLLLYHYLHLPMAYLSFH